MDRFYLDNLEQEQLIYFYSANWEVAKDGIKMVLKTVRSFSRYSISSWNMKDGVRCFEITLW